MVRRAVGDEAELELPEVEQCVRNILIHGSYQPMDAASLTGEDEFFTKFRAGQWSAEEVLAKYAAQVYLQAGSYEEAARRLGLGRRTVRAKVQKYLEEESK